MTTGGVFSIPEFILELKMMERDMELLPKAIAARACAMIAQQAKAQIGKEHEEWPPLAESTIADKQHHGFATPKPLLRTGSLRDSIEFTVWGHGGYAEGEVGSDGPRVPYHEFGTSRIPPRPVLWPAANVCEPGIVKVAAIM